MKYKAALFDLDGVLVDTAKYHYLAWKRLAEDLGFTFTHEDNERLKGVSRVRSLEILLEIGGIQADETQKELWASQKNSWYVEYLDRMDKSELFPGVREFLQELRQRGVKVALGSASKNAGLILDKLEIRDLFDCIVDGNVVSKAKPDPEVFAKAAEGCGVPARLSVVFEDAQAGIEAGNAAGCYVVGIGSEENLTGADILYASVAEINPDTLF